MGYIVNAFQIPNELVDCLLCKLSPNALKCYLVIVRKTIGWGKEYDAISASQFGQLTGIRKTDTIWAAIRELKNLGLIEDVPVSGKPTQFRVVISAYTRNGDTPKNGLPFSEGVTLTTKKGSTLKRGTQNPSSSKPNKPTISSSLPNQIFEDKEKRVVFSQIVLADPYSYIPEEGIGGLDRASIAEGIERLVVAYAGDEYSYRKTLIREVLSGEGRTIANIHRQLFPQPINLSRPRIGSNRGEPLLPPEINIFDVIENFYGEGEENVF